jgi:hypothetical protein
MNIPVNNMITGESQDLTVMDGGLQIGSDPPKEDIKITEILS